MIDIAAATRRGVAVANTPDYCVDEVVARHAGHGAWLVRGLGRFDAAVRDGQWAAAAAYPAAARPAGTVIGVVGLGRIGAQVAAQAAALGFEVLGHDPYAAAAPAGVRLTSLEDLLRRFPPGHAARAAHAGDPAPDPGGHDRADAPRGAGR